MMNLRNLIILFAVAWLSISVFAAEDSAQNNSPKQEQIKKQTTASQKASTGKRARVKTLEEFIPSEEVSADKPVAFPSDI